MPFYASWKLENPSPELPVVPEYKWTFWNSWYLILDRYYFYKLQLQLLFQEFFIFILYSHIYPIIYFLKNFEKKIKHPLLFVQIMTFFYTQYLHIIITLNRTWPFSVVHFKQNFERPYVFQVSQKYLQPKEDSLLTNVDQNWMLARRCNLW